MTESQLILSELAETRRELQQVKILLIALSGKPAKKPTKGKSVDEYRQERKISHLKKNIS